MCFKSASRHDGKGVGKHQNGKPYYGVLWLSMLDCGSKQVTRLSQGTGHGRRLGFDKALKPVRRLDGLADFGVVVVVVVTSSGSGLYAGCVCVWVLGYTLRLPSTEYCDGVRKLGCDYGSTSNAGGRAGPQGGWRWQWDGPSASVPALSRSRNEGNGRVCRQDGWADEAPAGPPSCYGTHTHCTSAARRPPATA